MGTITMNKVLCAVIVWLAAILPAQAQQALKLVTEEYPPLNMSGPPDASGKPTITGIATDVVREMMKRAGYEYTLELMSWSRAYSLAQEEPGYGVFSTAMIDSRLSLFKWVQPLVENRCVFFARDDRALAIDSIDTARIYRVGGYRDDVMALLLEEMGFKLDLVSRDRLNMLKLERGRIDLWPTGEQQGFHYMKEAGISGISPVFEIRRQVQGIAFHTSTSPEIIDRLNTILNELRQDGFIASVEARYR